MSNSSNINTNSKNTRLNKTTLHYATDLLCEKDTDLYQIVEKYGYPPLWARHANFPTLLQIILEQQVSLSSAQATLTKLKSIVSPLTPEKILELDFSGLRKLGFTRQKASYTLGLAQSIVSKEISLHKIAKFNPKDAREALMKIHGIGPWSADIYLLMALRYADIWPQNDLALTTAIIQVKRLRKKPNEKQIGKITTCWRPWRSVAARLLWHFYLSK